MRRRADSWLLWGGLALAAAGACTPAGEAPPRLLVDRSACAHCSMLISEPVFAAAYRADGEERLFDDLGCLLATLGPEHEPAPSQVWVQDFAGGGWLPAERSTFVHSPALQTPMASGWLAFADPAAAERLAARSGGRLAGGWAQLLEATGDAG